MKLDFDSFEFAGIIAPGSVIIVAIILLWPQFLKGSDSAILIALIILSAYVIGHLVSAIANLSVGVFRALGVRDLRECSREDIGKKFVSDDQLDPLETLVERKLHRRLPLWDEKKQPKWETVVKQMYILVAATGRPQRLETFEGLYNLSRGLSISFLICGSLTAITGRYVIAVACIVAAGLAVDRSIKFKDHFSKELLQQFLLLDRHDHSG